MRLTDRSTHDLLRAGIAIRRRARRWLRRTGLLRANEPCERAEPARLELDLGRRPGDIGQAPGVDGRRAVPGRLRRNRPLEGAREERRHRSAIDRRLVQPGMLETVQDEGLDRWVRTRGRGD